MSALDPKTFNLATDSLMEKKIMKNKNLSLHHWLFTFAGLIFLAGFTLTLIIFSRSDVHLYPAMIASAYQRKQHHLMAPGEKEVDLEKRGAYGIYYLNELDESASNEIEMPPMINCSLISKITKEKIHAVPDYVESNRYRVGDKTGVLLMSITVDQPGIYTFSCTSSKGIIEEKIHVALGPNFLWEFFQIVLKTAVPIISSVSIFSGSFLLSLLLLITGVLIKFLQKKKPDIQ